MGNLVLTADDEPDFRKGIISLWFRIPAATRAAVAAVSDPVDGDYNPFLKVIPLVTWGTQQSQACARTNSVVTDYPIPSPCSLDGGVVPLSVESLGGTVSRVAGPSYIGVRCWTDGNMTLEVNIQTADHPTCEGTSSLVEDWEWRIPVSGCPVPYPGCNEFESCIGNAFWPLFTDISSVDTNQLEYFGNRPDVSSGGVSGWGGPIGQPIISGTDKWHHVIISWDVTGGSSAIGWDSNADEFGLTRGHTSLGVGDFSKMWCSVDDTNMSGDNLPAMWPFFETSEPWIEGDPNAMLSYTPMGVSMTAVDDSGSPGTASVSISGVQFSPFCIPSGLSVEQTDNGAVTPNLLVEMADLQVFAGVTLDTTTELSRRLFVTDEGIPTGPSVAEAELGAPIVRLIGLRNWQTGLNTGTVGNLERIGTIIKFTPGPMLGT